jgi:transitional endoplasmic reticulum ATPase
MFSKYEGDSELELVATLELCARDAPSFLIIDDIDALSPASATTMNGLEDTINSNSRVEERMVAQLRALLDWLQPSHEQLTAAAAAASLSSSRVSSNKGLPPHVFIIATTNRLDALHSSLRVGGRFEREIELGPLNESSRLQLLLAYAPPHICQRHPSSSPTTSMPSSDERKRVLTAIASATAGMVGADLQRLCRDAAMLAIKRIQSLSINKNINSSDNISNNNGIATTSMNAIVTLDDMLGALEVSQPSSMMGQFKWRPQSQIGVIDEKSSSPTTSGAITLGRQSTLLNELGGVDHIIERLRLLVTMPVTLTPSSVSYEELNKRIGLRAPCGILLYGPSGVGKTAIATGVAMSSGLNILSVTSSELVTYQCHQTQMEH